MWGIRFCGLLRKTTRKSPEEVGPPPQAARRRQGPSEGSAGCFGRQRCSSSVPRSLTRGWGLTGRRWRAARREQAGGPTEGATRGRGLCRRHEPPSTTWPRKPRPERGGAGLRPARLARPRLPRHRRGRPATACHAGPRVPPHALQTVTRAPQPRRGWRGSRKAGRTGEPAPGARCSAGP